MSVQRLLIAGATGAIGRRLTPVLVARGHDVHALVRSDAAAATAAALGARPVVADALDRDAVLAAVDAVRPDTIVHHLTALSHGGRSRRSMAAALQATSRLRREATANLAAAAERSGVGRLVAQSIAFAYRPAGPAIVGEDHPLDAGAAGPWGDTVRAVAALEETVGAGRDVVGVVLRLGGLYGPGTAIAPGGFVLELARRRRLPVVGSGAGIQSFLHVDDAVQATVLALDAPAGVWNVVDDDPAPASEWIPALADAVGARPPRRVPAWLARLAAGEDAVRVMTVQRGASNARIRRDLGWRPERPSWRKAFLTLDELHHETNSATLHGPTPTPAERTPS